MAAVPLLDLIAMPGLVKPAGSPAMLALIAMPRLTVLARLMAVAPVR